MSFAVVLAAGTPPDGSLLAGAEDAELIVAADGGVRVARMFGLPLDAVVGDLDSASEGDLAWARAEAAEIERFSPDKDQTDLEIALDRADQAGVERIVVVGIQGNRLDHEFGNWATVCSPRTARVEVHTERGTAIVLNGMTHPQCEIEGAVGDLVSLVPRFGSVDGVTTTGLRWNLDDDSLSPVATRGISNEFVEASASISLRDGIMLVIQPAQVALNG